MFENEFEFPEDGLFDDDESVEGVDQSGKLKSDSDGVSRIEPLWFLKDGGGPEGFPSFERVMAKAFYLFQKGFPRFLFIL